MKMLIRSILFFTLSVSVLTGEKVFAEEKQCSLAIEGEASTKVEKTSKKSETAETKPALESLSVFESQTEIMGLQLEVDRLASEITSRKHPQFKAESLHLLNMLSNALFETAGDKLTNDNGKLFLAEKIADGTTVEFEYKGDERNGEKYMRLQKVVLVKPNGARSTIDGSPVDDGGTTLIRSSILVGAKRKSNGLELNVFSQIKDVSSKSPQLDAVAKARHEDDSENLLDFLNGASSVLTEGDLATLEAVQKDIQNIRVPILISGPVLKELVTWGNRLDVLKRSEFQAALKSKNLGTATIRAQVRSTAKYMIGIIRKQSFKYALIASIVVGANLAIPNAKQALDQIAPGHLAGAVASAPVKADGAAGLRLLLQSVDSDPASAQPLISAIVARTNPAAHVDRIASLSQLSTYISYLEKKEKKLGGDGRYYIGDAQMNFTKTKGFLAAPSGSGKKLGGTAQPAAAMISVFEKAGVISLHTVTSRGGEIIPDTSSIVVTRAGQPVAYAKILAKLDAIDTAP
jgi:uncharacterized small protein (DUF1192 family)